MSDKSWPRRLLRRMLALSARGLTLRRTMTLAVVLGVLSPALVMLVVEQYLSERSQQTLMAQAKASVMAIGVGSLVEPLWVIDGKALREAASKLLDNPQVIGVQILEDRPGADIIRMVRPGVSLQMPPTDTPQVEQRTSVIMRGEEVLGTLQVWFDAHYGQVLREQRRNQMLLLVVMQVTLSLLVLMMVLANRVLNPIERLKEQATALASNLSATTQPNWLRQDELGQLGRHLTQVQSQLAHLFHELEQKNEQLEQLALYDQLTGLPNRSLFHDLVQRELPLARRHEQRFGLLFIDLDRFKAVNDAMGHHAGDALLMEISQRLRQTLREVDVICRQSGDEFLVMVRDIEHWEQLGEVANRMLQAIEQPISVVELKTAVSASIGIAVFPDDADDFETLVKHADMAMYQAKTLGRARYSFYHSELNARLQASLELEQQLDQAIEHDELVLHYQPQIEAQTGRLVGVEALVRWQHPQRGLLLPGQFIAVAEECGKIADMGGWTLRHACRQFAYWQARGLDVGRLSVNVSALEFRGHRLLEGLQAALVSSGMAPNRLDVEITESVLMTDTDASELIMDHMRELGVGIVIDDFGTGYSSLAYLKRLRPTQLKIDQSFVRDIEFSPDSRAIIKGVLGLAHALGLSVVAEGVETAEQRDFLRTAGCPVLQGYLIARPLAVLEFENWFACQTLLAGAEATSKAASS